MMEQKRTINDPQKIETEVSRALDLAFDNKDLAVYGGVLKEEPSIDHDTIEKTVSDSKPLT